MIGPGSTPHHLPGLCACCKCGTVQVSDAECRDSAMLESAQSPAGSAVGEEVLQQRAALGFEDAAVYLHTMVEPRIAYDVEE